MTVLADKNTRVICQDLAGPQGALKAAEEE